jgi:ABC-type glycerol-3-phosphate transport system substrate-binding protein
LNFTTFKKIVMVTIVFFSFLVINQSIEARKKDNEQEANTFNYISRYENTYQLVYQSWIDQGYPIPKYKAYYGYDQLSTDHTVLDINGYNAFSLDRNDFFVVDFLVEQTGLYEIWLDYIVVGERTVNPLIQKEVAIHDEDYEIQYNEDSSIRLPIVWEKQSDTPTLDRYGDEIPIRVQNQAQWMNEVKIFDPASVVKEPLKNLFYEGQNKIRITLLNSVEIHIKGITISNSESQIEYQTYLNQHIAQGATRPQQKLFTVYAEHYTTKGSTNITTSGLMLPHMSQYAFNKRFLNAVEMSKPGQWIEYEADVDQAGLYKLALKTELFNRGLPVFRKISINGEVPFSEFNHLQINYQSGWQNFILGKNDEAFEVYLNEGLNTIRIETSPGLNQHFLALQKVLDDIQGLSIEITALTGGIQDINRTWRIERYIPDIVQRLNQMADVLETEFEALTSYSTFRAAQFNVLNISARQLRLLANEPDDIIEKAYLLNQGSSSAANMIAAALTGMMDEPMTMDVIYIYTDVRLPRARTNWVVNIWENIKMFVFSFVDPRFDVEISSDPNTVRVWVNRSKLHVDIMQRMVDELFTPKTGINVELIVLQNASRIVLANAAGRTPDIALSIGGGSVFDYASRNMLIDLKDLKDFQQAASEFNPNTFVPYIFEEGVYAMPETQDVALLFYRKDILRSLDLEVPNTWEDVLGMLPLLQSLGMNFYHPISGGAATKSINHMSPLIYQYGGEFYGETADEILVRSPETVPAVKFMIDLYNIYNLPLQIGSFYERFRNGTLPIGIGDQNMYIQLKYAAPEITGQWGIAPIPGIKNDQGIIERWDTALGSASVIFNNSQNKEQSWEFIKWWVSAEIQAEFSHELIMNFGDLFLYMTANLEGFMQSSWPEESKDAIMAQWEWIRIPPRLPGYYMLERELSNVYNKAVFEQTNFRSALDEAYFNIYREVNRKLIEFGYDENRKYRIPNNHNIHEWIGE